jgi:hypothetical protein
MEFLFPVDPLDDVRRLYRQACLHRLANETASATRILQEELPSRVARLQADDADGRCTPEAIRAALAEEHRRAVDAHVVGEWLFSRLQSGSVSPFPAATPAPSPAPAPSRDTAPAPREAMPAGGPQGIADMLDSMLAQERPRKTRA